MATATVASNNAV